MRPLRMNCGHPEACVVSADEGCGWCADLADRDEARAWVADLQAGIYVNCVYCGYRYGPESEVPVSMAEVLTAHVERCKAHPLSTALAALGRVRELLSWSEGCRGEALIGLDAATARAAKAEARAVVLEADLDEARRLAGALADAWMAVRSRPGPVMTMAKAVPQEWR